MPRRSNANSDESPVTRRTSARIAAAQAASPAKSPTKSPRRKSQVKSESSMEELNGIDTSSVKDTELTHDLAEIPHKKTKVDKKSDDGNKLCSIQLSVDHLCSDHEKTEVELLKENDAVVNQTQDSNTTSTDFEVVEHSSVPPPDSAEVQAAISAQGDDGQLLVGFVQVNKDELPPSNSLETKQVPAALESCNETVTCGAESVKRTDPNVEPYEPSKPNGTVHVEAHHKTPVPIEEPVIQPLVAPVTGDIVLDAVPEVVSQQ
ncbi:unnamed protein product [Schistosoma margrebowiei]|uniref:Uncharacterized protein n=1 Tax=Schistosoma margrebowiei TaxID=48269 RepID=A0A183LHD9_9TREM|nr:unnamed protein product [Schistosoma margrebowiei]